MRTDQVVLLLAVAAATVAVVVVIVRTRGRAREVAVDHARLLELQREWRAPAELLAPSVPRDVRYTRSARALIVLAGLGSAGLCTGAVLLIPGIQREQRDTDLVRRAGGATTATITGQREKRGKNASYHVTYAYDVSGRSYTSEARVRRRDYDRLWIGAPAAIHYAPARPALSRMDNAESPSPWLKLLIYLPAVFLLAIPWRATRLRKMLARGTPAGAIVTRVSPAKGGAAIRYQFLDPAGELVTGSDVVSRGEATAGEVITVLFDPERPRRNARYPLAMVGVEA